MWSSVLSRDRSVSRLALRRPTSRRHMLAEYAVLEEDVGFNADNALDYGVNSWSSGLFPLRIRWPINIVPAKPAETKRCQQHAAKCEFHCSATKVALVVNSAGFA